MVLLENKLKSGIIWRLNNSLGYSNKSADKWNKTWIDFKSNLKKKAADIKRERNKTGGGPLTCKNLTEFEEKVIQLLGSSFLGLDVPEVGLPTQIVSEFKNSNNEPSISTAATASSIMTSSETIIDEYHSIQNSNFNQEKPTNMSSHNNTITPTSQRFHLEEHNYQNKRKRSNAIEDCYSDTIQILNDIHNTLDNHLSAIVGHLKTIADSKSNNNCRCNEKKTF